MATMIFKNSNKYCKSPLFVKIMPIIIILFCLMLAGVIYYFTNTEHIEFTNNQKESGLKEEQMSDFERRLTYIPKKKEGLLYLICAEINPITVTPYSTDKELTKEAWVPISNYLVYYTYHYFGKEINCFDEQGNMPVTCYRNDTQLRGFNCRWNKGVKS